MAMSVPTALDVVDVPQHPGIPGLLFRHFRGPADFPGMIEANMAARDAYGIHDTVSVEGMAAQYANLTNSDTATDLVIIELDERIVGYIRVQWDDQQDGSRAYDAVALLRPELRGRGIGRAMLAWIQQRSREVAATHPDDGRERWLQAYNWDADEPAVRLLRHAGYEPIRRGFEMIRAKLDDLPEAPLPDGLEVRPITHDDLRSVWQAGAEAFRDHWGGHDESEEDWRRFRDDPNTDPDMIVVAFDGDEVAGVVVNVIDPADTARTGQVRGVLGAVYVRRAWRRRGLARALIARSLRLLRDRGATCALLGVDGENPNRAMTLYESCGFQIASSGTVWRKLLHQES
jgi:mycothiol synthase